MQINKQTLKEDGFTAFRSFKELDINRVPQAPGIYAVLKPGGFERLFLAKSTGGRFKKRNPFLWAKIIDRLSSARALALVSLVVHLGVLPVLVGSGHTAALISGAMSDGSWGIAGGLWLSVVLILGAATAALFQRQSHG